MEAVSGNWRTMAGQASDSTAAQTNSAVIAAASGTETVRLRSVPSPIAGLCGRRFDAAYR